MPLQRAEISRHAWLRFLKRWEGEPPACYRTELDRMLKVATEEHLGAGTALRLLQNNCKPARYFRHETWRFVTDEEVGKILTIERAYHKPKRPQKKIGNKRRYGGKP